MMRLGLQFFLCFVVFSLHLTLPYVKSGGRFSPFAVVPSGHIFDETHFYSPGPHRFARFGIASNDLDIFENRNAPGIYPQGPSLLIGGLAKAFGNFEWTWIFLHGLFAALLWLIASRVFNDRYLAWILVLLGFGPKLALLLSPGAFVEPPDVTRLPNPGLSALFLLGAMGLLVKCLRDGFSKWPAIALVVTGGALFEFYPFYGMIWFPTLALTFLFFRSRAFLIVILSSALLSAPTIARTLYYQSQLHQSIVLRQGFFSHAISWPGFFVFAFSFIGFLITLKRKQYLAAVSLAVLASSGLLSNLQVLTGVDIHYLLHYRMRVMQPIVIVLFCGWLATKVKYVTPVLVALLLVLTTYRQTVLGNNLLSAHKEASSRTEMLRWIRTNIPEPSVFSTTDLETIAMLPAISGQWSFVPSSYRTQASDEEILKRFVVAARLEGKTLSDVLAYFTSGPLKSAYAWTEPIYFFLRQPRLTTELIALLERLWNEGDDLGGRRLDYAIVKRSETGVPIEGLSIFENADWRIFPLRKNTLISAK